MSQQQQEPEPERHSPSPPPRDADADDNDNDNENSGDHRLLIDRPIYSQCDFETTFHDKVTHDGDANVALWKRVLRQAGSKARKCFPKNCKSFWSGLFPFVSIMSEFSWRHDFINDVIAGATVAFLHVPQAMAYGQLATLRPIHGFYVAVFPAIFYFFLGTSRQISMGVFAVISLMVAKVLDSEIEAGGYDLPPINSTNATEYENAEIAVRIEIATSVNIIVGVLQLILGMLGVGFLTDFLNEPFVSGYTTGCAFHVLVSQLWLAFGIKGVRHTGAFKIILTIKDLILKLDETHWITLVLFIAACAVLIVWKEFFGPLVKKKMPIPVPMELILIIVVTLISTFADLHEDHGVPIVGDIPSDFPAPSIPKYIRASYIVDSIPLVLVSFAISISLAKMLAKKHSYAISANQELIAMGTSNALSSLFMCYTVGSSLSRTLVQDNVGGRTQVASVVSSIILLIVVLAVGTYLEPLPKCILAAVVIVNLKGMFLQFSDLPRFWHICKLDALTWIVSLLATLIIDVDIGLYAGVACVLITLIIHSATTHFALTGRIQDTELFTSVAKSSKVTLSSGTAPVVKWSSPVYFANIEKLSTVMHNALEPSNRCEGEGSVNNDDDDVDVDENKPFEVDGTELEKSPAACSSSSTSTSKCVAVIFDLGSVPFIDTAGVEFFERSIKELAEQGTTLLLSDVPENVSQAMHRLPGLAEVLRLNTFVSSVDAVTALRTGGQHQFFTGKKTEQEKDDGDDGNEDNEGENNAANEDEQQQQQQQETAAVDGNNTELEAMSPKVDDKGNGGNDDDDDDDEGQHEESQH